MDDAAVLQAARVYEEVYTLRDTRDISDDTWGHLAEHAGDYLTNIVLDIWGGPRFRTAAELARWVYERQPAALAELGIEADA